MPRVLPPDPSYRPERQGTLFEPERVALCVRTIEKLKVGLLLFFAAAAVSACMVDDPFHAVRATPPPGGSDDPVAPPGTHYAVTVDWAGKGTGAHLSPGMDAAFAWEPAPVGSLVRLEVFRNNAHYEATLLNYAADAGAYTWTVPLDIELHDADYFQAKLTVVDGAVQTTVREERYSPPFQVVRMGTTSGLTDVTVNARHISITLTDDGSVVDGDRVDVFVNGTKVIDNHTLAGGAGTVFFLDLRAGSNELRVMALNEGTSSPNTAQLRLSDVTVGAAVQSWRLLAGESGSLVIYCDQP
jgi:hypothetical protein